MNFQGIKPRTKQVVAKWFSPLMASAMIEILSFLNWILFCLLVGWFMVFNATFNNISVISWR